MIKAEKLKKARNVILGNKKRLIAIIISLAVVIPSVTYALTINSHNPFVVSHTPATNNVFLAAGPNYTVDQSYLTITPIYDGNFQYGISISVNALYNGSVNLTGALQVNETNIPNGYVGEFSLGGFLPSNVYIFVNGMNYTNLFNTGTQVFDNAQAPPQIGFKILSGAAGQSGTLNLKFKEYSVDKLLVSTGGTVNSMVNMIPSDFTTNSPSPYLDYSMITGSAWDGSAFLLVGGKDFTSSTANPVMAIYYPSQSQLIDLTSLFQQNGMSNWGLLSAAWNGTAFIIAAFYYNSSSPTTITFELAAYDPGTNMITNLSHLISKSSLDWGVAAIASNGMGATYIAANYIPSVETDATPQLGVLNGNTFTNVSSYLPSFMQGHLLIGITYAGNSYYLASTQNLTPTSSDGFGSVMLNSFSPATYDFTQLFYTGIQNYYTNGGITWDGTGILIDSAIPGTYTLALYQPQIHAVSTLNTDISSLNGVPEQLSWDGSQFLIVGLNDATGYTPLLGTLTP
ncbi:MAG: hypothetical protein M0T81_02490 [Thermoplasmatales archaeon]|nr:hypothetical protein [Thermoplasmatales archaeon]